MRPVDAEKHTEEILRLIEEIEGFLQGVSFSEFGHRKSINYSVLYALLLIGETVKKIPPFISNNPSEHSLEGYHRNARCT